MALCPGLQGWASTRKVKPIWILLKQETVSGSGISWAVCKSAPRSRQITTPAPHYSVFYRPDALPATQPTVSKHWRTPAVCISSPLTIKSQSLIHISKIQQISLTVAVTPLHHNGQVKVHSHRNSAIFVSTVFRFPWLLLQSLWNTTYHPKNHTAL